MKKIIVTLLIIAGIISGILLFRKTMAKSNPSSISPQSFLGETFTPSPTPIPFYELTVPYLRERQYSSTIGSMEQAYSRGTYAGYVTSYTSDGLKINGLLTKPTGEMPSGGWPAIIFIHGYIPPNQYATLEKYADYVDYLARNGYVVFKIDLRGHGDSEGSPTGAYYSNGYVIDTLNAYAALQSTNFVNPQKIGLWGHSMAGNIVLRSIVSKPEIPAAVIWAGAGFTYQDLLDYRIRDLSYVPQPTRPETSGAPSRQRITEVAGPISDSSPFWQQFIPTHYLKDYKGAIQLDHAVDDDVVSVEYSRNLTKLLDQTSVPHELHEYPSGGHNITSSFVAAMQNTVEFYNRYIK